MISRRLFLRNTAAVGAVGATVAAPVAIEAAQPEFIGDRVSRLLKELTEALTEFGDGQFKAVVYPTMHKSGVTHLATADISPRDQAEAHIRALYSLAREDGALRPVVIVSGTYGPGDARCLAIDIGGRLSDKDGMFAGKGGAA